MSCDVADVTIEFGDHDYIVDGKPLYGVLFTGRRAKSPAQLGGARQDHVAAAAISRDAVRRLNLEAEPDLIGGFTALYLCGHCGGYEGSPIAAKIEDDGTYILWRDFSFGSEDAFDDFQRIDNSLPDLRFTRSNYRDFLKNISFYETA